MPDEAMGTYMIFKNVSNESNNPLAPPDVEFFGCANKSLTFNNVKQAAESEK